MIWLNESVAACWRVLGVHDVPLHVGLVEDVAFCHQYLVVEVRHLEGLMLRYAEGNRLIGRDAYTHTRKKP